jgi:taurine---2-oxoglutarate transaminase
LTDWNAIENWDRAYYLHNTAGRGDYSFWAVDRQDGAYLTMSDGSRLLDFQSQLISDSMGHRHPAIYAEISKAMERYGHVFFGMAHEYRGRAAKLIIEDVLGADSWAGRVRILASGGEAVDCAITMARLYTGKQVVLTQAHGFHGLSVGATMLRGYRNNLSTPEEPMVVRDVPGFPNPGFMPVPPPEPADFHARGPLPSIEATRAIIRAVGPENIAAVITEPMLGAGGLFPHPDYMPALHALIREFGLLWIDDEVLCGFGRLGEWFGYQLHPGIHPDIMAVGKSINGSSLPAGAVIASKPIGQFFEDARWWSGSTWDGHPLICASIVGCLEAMLADDMLSQIRAKSAHLKRGLDVLKQRHPSIGRIAGAGLYFAVDLVGKDGLPIIADDRWTGFTGDLSQNPNAIIARECAARGVFLGGFVPNTVKVGPPFIISLDEIDQGLAAFDAALTVLETGASAED